MNNYPCTGCGECCRRLAGVLNVFALTQPGDPFYEELTEFPYKPTPSGACPMLQEDNSCGVYEDRPRLCDSHGLYQRYFAGKQSLLEFDINQMMVCNTLVKDAGLPSRYLVRL